jgi:ankyrin repeat protein
VDAERYTALHHACEGGADVGIIQFLLSVYEMAACVTTRKHDTALHIACGKNASNDTVRLLIEANPAALNMTNDYGFTPLHCVCRAYQPRMGIVQALLEACPSSISQRTNGGETAVHLACSSGAFVGVLQMLTLAQNQMSENMTFSLCTAMLTEGTANKIGNSPLHEACFRGASFEHIETLAKSTPEWIVVRNNAGYTPLQVMCKSGRLDERVVTAFSRIRGHEVFSVMDSAGHTPLHSACREGTSIAAIRSLIQAFPDALHLKTTYGDTPLHLSCLRRASADVVEEIAVSSFGERTSTLLATNTAGQTPIGIAMGEFQTICIGEMGCGIASNYTASQIRAFDVLAVLVKLLYYGVSSYGGGPRSLVKACVCLHRRGIRLNPTFIRRAIDLYPDEVRQLDDDFNHPFHIEASIPVEKMSLLDGPARNCCGRKCYSRARVLSSLLAVYPRQRKSKILLTSSLLDS